MINELKRRELLSEDLFHFKYTINETVDVIDNETKQKLKSKYSNKDDDFEYFNI